jgi:hypothetical protein
VKCRNLTQLRSLVAVLAFGLAGRGYAQTSAYELCIEQSPAQAGRLTPDSGTHQFAPDAVVVLSAEPRPGYHFAYWLGDVADPKAQRTTVQVNSPKVVVAVFQTTRHDYPQEVLIGGGGGGGKTVATAVDLSVPGWSIVSGGTKAQSAVVSKPNVVPVPEPVPEPTTIALLGLGVVALRRRLR